MAGGKRPGPCCIHNNPDAIEDGTLCRAVSPAPGPLLANETGPHTISPAYRIAIDIPFSVAPQMTWDGFQRLFYGKLSAGLQQQARTLLNRGNIGYEELDNLVKARNSAVLQFRDRLTPFGEMYSELLKPRSTLKTTRQLLEEKGSFAAVLRSVGKTRQVVDRIVVVSRWAGPASIMLEVSVVTFAIAEAPPQARGRVAATQIAGSLGGVMGGSGGMWLGCVGGATVASWSLVVPIIGEGATGGACLVGGLLGGLGLGFGGRKLGEKLGAGAYDFATEFHWVQQR